MALNPFQGLKPLDTSDPGNPPSGLNGPKSLSGIETKSTPTISADGGVSMALNPFQGLKRCTRKPESSREVSMALNPFQGLKPVMAISPITAWSLNGPKSLSGIETDKFAIFF